MLWLERRIDALMRRAEMFVLRRRLGRALAQLSPDAVERARRWRKLYQARNARLQREREARAGRRGSAAAAQMTAPANISKADVLAAIARSRARREAQRRAKFAGPENGDAPQ
ncbi:MAG: hypothetical protein C4338_02830 [Rhodanobacteraceae bacterium]